MSDYDSPWKEALADYFPHFVAMFLPEAHADIDWSRGYESLDKELQRVVRDAEEGRRVVDHLVKVWRWNGEEDWLLVHVEVQGQEISDFARRMFVCNYRLYDRYTRIVVSVGVLTDDRPGWRPDRFGYELWGCSVGFRFPVVKLLDVAEDVDRLERSANPFAALVLAHLKTRETRHDPEARQAWKVRLVKGLYQRGLTASDVRRLFRFIDWMMDLPEDLEESFWAEIHRYEEETHMPFIDVAERTGIQKGLEQGRVEGREQGRAEGRAEALLASLERALQTRFGAAGVALMPEIRNRQDTATLLKLLEAVLTAATLDDARRSWS